MLSEEHINFLQSKDYFLLKQEVDNQLNSILYALQQNILNCWQSCEEWNLPVGISKTPGKIIKGYNHNNFPYQVFDFPSIFEKKNIFTFRVVVWYGNFFSINLILTKKFKDLYKNNPERFLDSQTQLLKSENIWETDTSSLHSIPMHIDYMNEISAYFEKSESIRLFRRFNMNQINDIHRLTLECFNDWFAN